MKCEQDLMTSDTAAPPANQDRAIRALHLRWGEFPVQVAHWTVRAATIDKTPLDPMRPASALSARSLAAAANAILLEIPASPFQKILFPHRNPLKNLLWLPALLPFSWHYILLLTFLARAGKPLIIFDLQDSAGIAARFLPLVKIAARYHKRELPKSLANTFQHTEIFAIEPWRNRGRYAAQIAKLRPLSIGAAFTPIPFRPRTKDIDVFWAGTVENSPVRQRGLRLLRELQEEGYRVVILGERVEKEAFFDYIARAWLTFCPDGNGWQCWRMFEAGCLGSVPLLSYPTVWQDAPFREREHCFYYNPEGDDLKAVIKRALADKKHLTEMCAAVRGFVVSEHAAPAVYYRHLESSGHAN